MDTQCTIRSSGSPMDSFDASGQIRIGQGTGRWRASAPRVVAARDTPSVRLMVETGNMAWFAVINSKTETTSRRSEQTRPRLLPGYLSPGEAGEAPHAPRSSGRLTDSHHHGQPA